MKKIIYALLFCSYFVSSQSLASGVNYEVAISCLSKAKKSLQAHFDDNSSSVESILGFSGLKKVKKTDEGKKFSVNRHENLGLGSSDSYVYLDEKRNKSEVAFIKHILTPKGEFTCKFPQSIEGIKIEKWNTREMRISGLKKSPFRVEIWERFASSLLAFKKHAFIECERKPESDGRLSDELDSLVKAYLKAPDDVSRIQSTNKGPKGNDPDSVSKRFKYPSLCAGISGEYKEYQRRALIKARTAWRRTHNMPKGETRPKTNAIQKAIDNFKK